MRSSIGEEVHTETSEDYGFKKLGQVAILPSYNEKLPFASLQNLDISNENGLYIASSGGKVVIGDLQLLRDFIQNHKDTEISFRWEKALDDVIAVKFLPDNEALIVCRTGVVYKIDCANFDSFEEACSLKQPLLQVSVSRSKQLLAMTSEQELLCYDLGKSSAPIEIADGVASFDSLGDEVYLLLSNNSIQIRRLAGDHLELQSTLAVPPELLEELGDQYQPLLLKVLNKKQLLVVYGEGVPESAEDVMYDHKMYIVNFSAENSTFSESFDITPAFGSVLRYPTAYDVHIEALTGESETINILASACSSEISIWDSAEVVQPSQDSERAVLPISKVTDNDTNPVGMALDIRTTGNISEPCQGVESVEKLPLIYILNNEGSLQIVGLYHSSAIKEGTFKVPDVSRPATDLVAGADFKQVEDSADRASDAEETTVHEVARESKNTASSSGEETKSVAAGTKSENSFGAPAFKSVNTGSAFGSPAFGISESKPAFGTPSFGSTNTELAFGNSPFGQSGSKPAFGSPAFGAPSFGSADSKVAFGTSEDKPTFGTPSFGSSGAESAFGKPSFGHFGAKPAFGSSAFGKTSFSDLGSKPALSAPENKPAFGTPSFGDSGTQSAFGKPSFGDFSTKPTLVTPSLGGTNTSSTFGSPGFVGSDNKPSFGSISTTTPPKGSESKHAFGTASFGTSSKSPFSSLSSSTFQGQNLPFASAPFKKFAENKLPSSGESPSPFASLANKMTDDSQKAAFASSDKLGDFSSTFVASEEQANDLKISNADRERAASAEASYEDLPDEKAQKKALAREAEKESEDEALSSSENLESEEEDQKLSEVGSQEESELSRDKRDFKDTDLSDSTVERGTPSQIQITDHTEDAKSSISAITARIKEGAKLSSSDLQINQFGREDDRRSASPFTAFAGDLKKASSPGFSFASISSSSEKADKRISEKSAVGTAQGNASHSTKPINSSDATASTEKEEAIQRNPFLTKHDDASHGDSQAVIDKSSLKLNTVLKPSSNDINSADAANDSDTLERHNEKDFSSNKPKDASYAQIATSQGLDMTTADNDLSNSEENETTRDSDSSREESYDALDDVLQEELDEAIKTKNQAQKVELPSTIDKALPPKETVEVKKEYISQGIQVYEAVDSALQADIPTACDFTVQSFENDETICALQNMPKSLPEYFTSANITAINFSSQDLTMRSIEKTYHVLSSEIAVWQENAKNIEDFLKDQSTSCIERRTIASVPNVYTWRLQESEKLQDIMSEEMSAFSGSARKIEQLQEQLAKSKVEKARDLQEELYKVKNDYYHYEISSSNPGFAELKHHQLEMQSELRRKMLNAAERLNHIEEMLQILKLYTIDREEIGNNAYVHKLARDLADRDNLCNEITRLREQVDELISRNRSSERQADASKSPDVSNQEIQSLPVAELCLKLRTRMQIGSLLKRR
ncbi:hypothetical protein HG536_0B03120 [Torulaspora globosa]|uniref:Nucleoporin Nup159/Nup146 N-terminal domain-containing protein n=1 Tax=Torulaspora globosa TaxID=48254 RepID=A0A7G3ZD63_9SACH|nr:uncharacterized protein HG536_0B03120 [Torulaspora globosa]QLL31449.1 hypothetical protein HG536_0B03120 [Torulaspora globosa]